MLLGLGFCDFFFSHKSAPFLWILPSQFSVLGSFCFTNSKMCFFVCLFVFRGGVMSLYLSKGQLESLILYFIGGGGKHKGGSKEQWVAFGLF